MSDLHDNSNNTELQDVPDIENGKAGADIPAERTQQVHQANHDETRNEIPHRIDSRCIYRVSPHLRARMKEQVYEPMVVSLGPYHHGKPQCHQMEELKERKLNQFITKSVARDPTKDKDFFLGEIKKDMYTLRENYEKVDKHTEEALVEIILRDACFLIATMVQTANELGEIVDSLGLPTGVLVMRDLNILENQIPFWVIKRLLYLRYDKYIADKIVYNYLNRICSLSENSKLTTLPWNDDGRQPLHILEAKRTALLNQATANETQTHFLTKTLKCMTFWKTGGGGSSNNNNNNRKKDEEDVYLAYSVTFLQGKGIYIKMSSQCLQDIRFTSYHFYGVLHLPILAVNFQTKVLFSNFVAFEMSPRDQTQGEMLPYINFLKLLIDTSKDVNELRQRGILCIKHNTAVNDEEVVKLFRELDTFEVHNLGIFAQTRRAINNHCWSKPKTWMADLYYNYFRNPWTIIAVFITTFILCLTFLQTYYTINPRN